MAKNGAPPCRHLRRRLLQALRALQPPRGRKGGILPLPARPLEGRPPRRSPAICYLRSTSAPAVRADGRSTPRGEAAGPADPAPSSMGVQAPPAHPAATINSRPSCLLRRKEVDLPRERRPTCPEAFPLSILAMGRRRDSVSVLAAETLGERFGANGPKDSRHEFRATIGRGAARRGEVASGSVARKGSQRRCDSSTTASINTGLSPALFADVAGRA
jgi:hypothetical protein